MARLLARLEAGGQGNAFGYYAGGIPVTGIGDAGGASRFYYVAKPSREERDFGTVGLVERLVLPHRRHPTRPTWRRR